MSPAWPGGWTITRLTPEGVDEAAILHGPGNNIGFLFNPRMGAAIGLPEPEPAAIIATLSMLARRSAKAARAARPDLPVGAVVQYGNESDLYYADPALVAAIEAERAGPEPVLAFVHQTSDTQPLKPGFLPKMAQISGLLPRFGCRNVCVHLPLDKADTTPALLDELCSDAFLDIVARSGMVVDLENNWHASWFGYPGNLVAFFGALDDRLDETGRGDLKQCFGMTFDSGHLLAQCKPARLDAGRQLEILFPALKDRIRTLHLHCNDGSGDQHLLFANPARAGLPAAFRANQEAVLAALPLLDLPGRARAGGSTRDTIVIAECSVPFTPGDLDAHARLVFEHA